MDQEYRPSRFQILPPIVKNLLIINGIMYLLTVVLAQKFDYDLADVLGLHYPLADKFRPYQLITYLFMHGSLTHLIFNMFALWMFGNALENLWGPKRFVIYYLITGIGAVVIHYTIVYFQYQPTVDLINNYINHPSLQVFQDFIHSNHIKAASQDIVDHYNSVIPKSYSQALANNNMQEALNISVEFMRTYKIDFLNAPVVIGASGSVFGILIGFGMTFPNTELIIIPIPFPIKAKFAVIGYGAVELFLGIANFSWDNVAHFAHLGGALFGFIIIKYWNKNNRQQFY